ncbi:MAG TPA: M1 family metallopeptidase [Thermoleophilaceae bacterium]|nr:M1 family metallopeptidase [Thermoleophilaceae bacterium]
MTRSLGVLLGLILLMALGVAPAQAAAPKFEPGARSAGDPILPQIGNGGYDALRYDIALGVTPANRFSGAVTTMSARATQNLSELSMDFQDLAIRSVHVNGRRAFFSQVDATPQLSSDPAITQPKKLVIKPPAGIRRGDRFQVRVDYGGAQPQVFTDPDYSSEGWVPACYTPAGGTQVCDSNFVVGEPMGAQAWFPSNNHPTDKAAFETSITVPAGQTAFGVGELRRRRPNANGSVTWIWSEDDPTATYLVTASNGVFDYTQSTLRSGRRTIPNYNAIDPSATPAQKTALATTLGRTQEIMDFLADRYGPYPFDSNGALVDRAPSVGYALEVQGKSHYSSLNTSQSTVAHEIAHQWFGNAVTLEHWNDIWFNEGWARLAQWDWNFADGTSPASAKQQFEANYAAATPQDWALAPAVLDNDPANLFLTFPTYTRGGMTLEGYRQIVGERRFNAFARSLQRRYAYGNIGTRRFIAEAVQASGLRGAKAQLLGQYFEQWLYGTVKPTLVPASFSG